MQTRYNNLIYEHKHDHYGWHPKARVHKDPEYRIKCTCGEIIDIPYHRYASTICKNCGKQITEDNKL